MFIPACDRPSVAEPTGPQGRTIMERGRAAIHRKAASIVPPTPHYWICP
jgi:hypothetical protein